jgi:outer membrane lipoprotein-sorting protein
MITVLSVFLLASATPKFEDIVQSSLKDLSLTAKVSKANFGELRKISRDFATAYNFTSMTLKYKQPSKMRMDGTYQSAHISYVLVGAKKVINIPAVKQRITEDTKESPGKRQSMLDFGIIDKGVTEFMKGKYVRTDRESNEWVFDLTYVYNDDTSRHRVWVDPTTKVITKREWYGQEGRLKATFFYRDVKSYSGVYVPTTVEVQNVEGKSAGTTSYSNIKANSGTIPDSTFQI